MNESKEPVDRAWDCGWEEHRRRQLKRFARLSLAEKLEWLEEAQRLAETLHAQRRPAAGSDCPPC
jgi:hypothetical protein